MDFFSDLGKSDSFLADPWAQAMAIFIAFIVLTVILHWSLKILFSALAKKTKTELDDIAIRALRKAITLVVPTVGLMVALTPLNLSSKAPHRILFSLIVVFLMRAVIGLTSDFANWLKHTWVKRTESTLDDGMLPLLRRVATGIIVILGVLAIFGKWEIQIGPILGALGIGGLAIGLALNSSLANIFGGIQLILDRCINVGDKVMLDSGEVGIVLDVGLRSTKMRTYENEVIFLPNSQLANAKIKNFTEPDSSIRVTVNFSVIYGSDVAQVKQLVLDAIQELDDILDDPLPAVLFMNMGDFSLDMSARVWVNDYGMQFGKKLEMTELVYNVLNKNNIEIPFPTQTIYMAGQN